MRFAIEMRERSAPSAIMVSAIASSAEKITLSMISPYAGARSGQPLWVLRRAAASRVAKDLPRPGCPANRVSLPSGMRKRQSHFTFFSSIRSALNNSTPVTGSSISRVSAFHARTNSSRLPFNFK
jgi:hypothetical protein